MIFSIFRLLKIIKNTSRLQKFMKLFPIIDCIFLSMPAKNHVQIPCIDLFRAHYDSSRIGDVSSCQRAKCIKCYIGGCVLPAYAWQPMPSYLQPPSPTPHPCHVASICCLGIMGLVWGWGVATHGGGGLGRHAAAMGAPQKRGKRRGSCEMGLSRLFFAWESTELLGTPSQMRGHVDNNLILQRTTTRVGVAVGG
jgi:hypothetical protein